MSFFFIPKIVNGFAITCFNSFENILIWFWKYLLFRSRISSCNNNEVNTKPKHVQADDNKSDDKNNRQNEGDGEQVTKSSVCPEGIDQDVFNQLPEDIKLEISQSMKLKKNQNSSSIISNQMNQKSNSKSKGPKKRITPKSENIMKYFSRKK